MEEQILDGPEGGGGSWLVHLEEWRMANLPRTWPRPSRAAPSGSEGSSHNAGSVADTETLHIACVCPSRLYIEGGGWWDWIYVCMSKWMHVCACVRVWVYVQCICVYVPVDVCTCACLFMGVLAHMHTCKHACGGRRLIWGIFRNLSAPRIFRQGLSPNSPTHPDWLASEPPDPSTSASLALRLQMHATTPSSSCGLWGGQIRVFTLVCHALYLLSHLSNQQIYI